VLVRACLVIDVCEERGGESSVENACHKLKLVLECHTNTLQHTGYLLPDTHTHIHMQAHIHTHVQATKWLHAPS